MSVDPKRAEAVFAAAIQLADAAERSAFLDQECQGDDPLRCRVEVLLAAHDDSASLPPAMTRDDTQPYISNFELVGSVIAGRYRLLQQIGEGGMGTVFMAEQEEPVRRKVALKIIKPGMDSKQVVARFEAEQQALAMMDHVNIAKVHDAGTTENGRPYFVMELVHGVPMVEYCDANKLTLRERLELFVPVCQAIQHAHQKGIIHRDIKPSNVLITMYDDKPVPKVIDFGIAKAIEQRLTEKTLFTQFGTLIGTFEYMSPEQAEMNAFGVDTRSDVYSLGVLLYELLTGTTPLERSRMRKAALGEIVRLIKEEEAPRPSIRLSKSDTLAKVAAARKTEPAKLSSLMRGELDWIVMRCLEKDRSRRYETASGLARDVQRYLADEVVEARPPSTGYRLKKFVRRHKGPVVTAALVLLTLLAGIAGTTFGLIRAEYKRIEADERKEIAEEEKKIAQQIRDFLQTKLLGQADVNAQANALMQGGGLVSLTKHNPTVRELLDRAAAELTEDKIEKNFPNQPRLQAEILMTVGNTYLAIGYADRAAEFLKRALAIREKALGPRHADTLKSMHSLAEAYLSADKTDLAESLCKETLGLRQTVLGPRHADTLKTMNILGVTYRRAGKPNLAVPLLKDTLALRKATLGPKDIDTIRSIHNLSGAYWHANKRVEALTLMEEAYKLEKATFGPKHPTTLVFMIDLAFVYVQSGKADLALPLSNEALEHCKTVLGPSHPHTITCMNTLAFAHRASGEEKLAVSLLEDSLQIAKTNLGAKHPQTFYTMNNLAVAYGTAGMPEKSLPLLKEALKHYQEIVGPEHPDTLQVMNSLGGAYIAVGNPDQAVPILERTLKLRKEKLDQHHPDILQTVKLLAGACEHCGMKERALELYEEMLETKRETLGSDDPAVLDDMNKLGVSYWKLKRLDKSVPLFQTALELTTKKFGPDHFKTLTAKANLGVNYLDDGRPEDALALLEDVHRATAKDPAFGFVAERLLQAYAQTGNTGKAAELLMKKLADARARFPENSIQLVGESVSIAVSLLNVKAHAEAESIMRESLTLLETKAPDAWVTFDMKSVLGWALLEQRKYAEAEPLLLAGYQGMKQREKTMPPHRKTRLVDAADRLVRLYEATGQKDDAARWRKIWESEVGKTVGPIHEVGQGLKLQGRLDSATTSLVYQVKLSAGKTYVIDMVSADTKALDPYLMLIDAAREKVAQDDDGGDGLNARIVYRPAQGGVYRIQVTSFNRGVGDFTLTVREQPKQTPEATNRQEFKEKAT